ncbi:MucBP domain-containing protein [Lactiplantibacillus daoliensis]|uniref:MucBP domain-containing protein n=1 Tax=Lactiplantibacillus daoliensis TaxID=2559916 RepID=A0ABW1UID8_9LACO|nr:MucBP domain-containing protein [Lactiplantibacillus daoliensis]
MQLSETKCHYKMYKQGKTWVTMGLATTAVLIGAQVEVLAANGDSQAYMTSDESVTAIIRPTATIQSEAVVPLASQVAAPNNDSATNVVEDPRSAVAESPVDNPAAEAEQPGQDDSTNKPAEVPVQPESAVQKPAESAETVPTDSAEASQSESAASHATEQPATSAGTPNESDLAASDATLIEKTPVTNETSTLEKPTESASNTADTEAKPVSQAAATVASQSYPQAEIDINTWMPDKNFQQVTLWVINSELGLGLTDVNQITQAMMSQLKLYFVTTEHQVDDRDFYFAVMNTVSLKGFEYATNVEKLWFSPDLDANEKWQDKYVIYGKLKDISALKGLDNLVEINLQLNDIDDISALAGLHLQELSLSYNHISDFSPLASSLPTLSSAITIANQKVVLKDTVTLDIDPKTGKLVTPSFAFGKDKTHNLSITPVADSDADGVNLTDTTIEWTNFKQSGYLKYKWHDEWMGAHGYPCDGYVWIPFYIQNDGSGSIQIEFVDEQGQHLGSDVYINNWLDATYDVGTDQQVIDQLQALKGQHYGIKAIKGSPNWTAGKEMAHLTYVLARIQPSVDFQVVDEAGKPIPGVTIPSQQGEIDGDWQVTLPSIPGYELVQATENGQALTVTNGHLTGKFSDNQTIQLIYRVKSQHATIHFEYEDGRSAGDDVQLTGKYGELIQFPAVPNIPGYFADDLPAVYYQDGDNNYTVVYRRAGQVTIQYVDEAGNSISPTEELTGKVGSDYQTAPKQIAGYTLVKEPVNQNGQFSESSTTVIYHYLKDSVAVSDGQPVTIQYVDEAGNSLATEAVLTGKVGDTYAATPKTIAGYELIKVIGDQNGTFGNQNQTITFLYRLLEAKKGQVTIQYVDETGREIAKNGVLTGGLGQAYQVTALNIDGYRLKQTVGASAGSFSEGETTLTFIYERIVSTGDVGQTNDDVPTVVKPSPGLSESAQVTEKPTTTQTQTPSTRPVLAVKPVPGSSQAEPVANLQPLNQPQTATATELPQTGEQRLSWVSVLGTCLLGLVAYVAGRKRV